jgi:histone acetyltransferase (RNA polymerase elongator complex component)
MNIFDYEASDGKEFFMTFEDKEDRTIFSLLRLRLPETDKNIDAEIAKLYEFLPELAGAALIREIHTF